MPDGLYQDIPSLRDAVLRAVRHRCQLWLEHLLGSHVHIGDSTIEPERRPGHGEPARCYGGPPGLPGAGHRANPWNERWLASSLGTSYLPGNTAASAATYLSRISKVTLFRHYIHPFQTDECVVFAVSTRFTEAILWPRRNTTATSR